MLNSIEKPQPFFTGLLTLGIIYTAGTCITIGDMLTKSCTIDLDYEYKKKLYHYKIKLF